MARKGLIWPTAWTLLGLAVLLSLGTWQWQRLGWKTDLIAKLEIRAKAAPVSIESVLGGDDIEYAHVTAKGRFRHDLERYIYATGTGEWGWHVLTPLDLVGGRTILVNRGFVPRDLKDPASRPASLSPGDVAVTGLLRNAAPARPWYIPAGDRKALTWSYPEIADIAATVPGAEAGFTLEADATDAQVPPKGGATQFAPSNRHLEYALTWYALAATLAGVYLYALWRRRPPNAG